MSARRRALGALAALVLLAPSSWAEEAVIAAGREAEVMALLAPHPLGAEVAPGYRLFNVAISPREIRIELRAADGGAANVRLVHPSAAPNAAEQSASFSILRDARASRGEGALAADMVVSAVRRNDRKGFWSHPVPASPRPSPEPARARALIVPLILTLAFAGVMGWVARRALTSRPGSGPGSPSA